MLTIGKFANRARLILLAFVAPVFLAGCEGCLTPDPFTIRVTDVNNQPLDSVLVTGISDETGGAIGTGYNVRQSYWTGSDGRVEVAGSNSGYEAGFYRSDYFPRKARLHADNTYQLDSTELKCRPIARLEGDWFAFKGDGVISMSRDGDYYYTDLQGARVTSLTGFLPAPVDGYKLSGENAWVACWDTTIIRLDVTNPASPVVTGRFSVYRRPYILAVSDSILILNFEHEENPMVYRVTPDRLIRTWGMENYSRDLYGASIIGSRLILAYYTQWAVWDISNPYDCQQEAFHSEQRSIRLQDTLLFVGVFTGSSANNQYQMYALRASGPAQLITTLSTPMDLKYLIDMNTALLEERSFTGSFLADRAPGSSTFEMRGFHRATCSAIRPPCGVFWEANSVYLSPYRAEPVLRVWSR